MVKPKQRNMRMVQRLWNIYGRASKKCYWFASGTNSKASIMWNLFIYLFCFSPTIPTEDISVYLKIFSISFYWYCLIGSTICIVVALIISYFSEENDPPVARELLSPIIYGIIDEDKYINRLDLEYSGIDEAISRLEGKNLDRTSSKWEEMRQERMRKMSMLSNVDIWNF